jgi:hypothetical protein
MALQMTGQHRLTNAPTRQSATPFITEMTNSLFALSEPADCVKTAMQNRRPAETGTFTVFSSRPDSPYSAGACFPRQSGSPETMNVPFFALGSERADDEAVASEPTWAFPDHACAFRVPAVLILQASLHCGVVLRGSMTAFAKMHGLGNDFIVLEVADGEAVPSTAVLRRLADRRTGIGFDQALILQPPRQSGTDVYYRIFNFDGSEVEQCGNGAR